MQEAHARACCVGGSSYKTALVQPFPELVSMADTPDVGCRAGRRLHARIHSNLSWPAPTTRCRGLPVAQGGVLLIDWENLAGSVVGRSSRVTSSLIDKIWEFGQAFTEGELQKKHIAAADFEESIKRAVESKLIKVEPVRGEKEQADIALTVLAMDYLHEGFRSFIIVTGDQDFVPLIFRLHGEGCRIAVILGNPGRISSSLDAILRLPGIEKHDVADVVGVLPPIPKLDSSRKARTTLALMQLQAEGFYLSGQDKNGRLDRFRSWGFSDITSDTDYWSLVGSLCSQVEQRRSAVRTNGNWTAQPRRRTRLALTQDAVALIHGLDHLVRRIARRRRNVHVDELRSGPFKSDDGSKLTTALSALQAVEVIRKHGDGSFTLADPDSAIGWVEPLWRVYGSVRAESIRLKSSSIPFHSLESMLNRQGLGPGPDNRTANSIRRAISFAKSFGAIDVIAENDARRIEPNSADKLCVGLDHSLRALAQIVQPGIQIGQHELINKMAELDQGVKFPIFGWDDTDRHRVVRVLSQSRVLRREGEKISVNDHHWF